MLREKVTFSLPCLKSLVTTDNSCVFCKTNYKRSLTLLPIHLHDLKKSVRELLTSKVTTYDIELGGIILSHKHVKIWSSVEMNDEGHFTLDYVADIYIFTPKIGSILSGRINKKGRDVLGCLVHSVFNVALPRPRCEEDTPKKWIGSKALIGQSVTFSVVKLDFTGRLPYIRGQVLRLEDNGMTDDDGVDSGMGFQESNEDDCSIVSIISPQTSLIENKSSHYSLKRKRNSDIIMADTPKSNKKRFLGNTSDEGVSGEESLCTYPASTDAPNKMIKKDEMKVKKTLVNNSLKNSEVSPTFSTYFDKEMKIKEEPLDETTSGVDTSSKSKKRKKKKDTASASLSSHVEVENLSSVLLIETLEKNKIKTENTLFEINDYLNVKESLSPDCKQEKLKVKKKERRTKSAVSENMDNLSFSLLKEAMETALEEVAQEVANNSTGNILQERADELSDRKKKKKKKHSGKDELEHHGKSKINTSKQSVPSQDCNRTSAEENYVLKKKEKKKKTNENSEDSVKKLLHSKIAECIKHEDENLVEGKKEKKKHKHPDEMIEISSSLLEQAINDLAIKLENIKQEEQELSDKNIVSNKSPSKKKTSSKKVETDKLNLEAVKKEPLVGELINSENDLEIKSENNSNFCQSSSEKILENVRKKKKQRSLNPYLK